VVLRARHEQEGQDFGEVVLKFLHPQMADDPSIRQRFMNEARAARKLTSPHIVKIFDFDFDEQGHPFIVMEYLRGEELHALIKRGPLEPARLVRISRQITGALQECHDAGILHRDLTPKNIILLGGHRQDFVKVLDFGIARLPDTTLSMTMLGTPRYMAPEQILQEDLDARADIFALGVLLFQSLSGQPPIRAKKSVEYLQLNLDTRPRLLRSLCPQLPEALEQLLHAMMGKERDERPSSMLEVERRLLTIAEDQGWRIAEGSTPGASPKSDEAQIAAPGPLRPPQDERAPDAEAVPTRPVLRVDQGPLTSTESLTGTQSATHSEGATHSELPGTLAPVVRTTRPPRPPRRLALVWGSALVFIGVAGVVLFFAVLHFPGQDPAPAHALPDMEPGIADPTVTAIDLAADLVVVDAGAVDGPAPDAIRAPDAAVAPAPRIHRHVRLKPAPAPKVHRPARPRPALKRPARHPLPDRAPARKRPTKQKDDFKKLEGGL